ncbi:MULTISPECIES: hypothetical protein [unclassified Isoptericola]|uniref:hypothetical protein n=1 Tax=unclassified Isoptericola TaxID=2623355 RepID=UPI00365833A4
MTDPDRAAERAIDFRPLTEPVDQRLVPAYDAELHRRAGLRAPSGGSGAGCFVAIALPIGLLFAGAFWMGYASRPTEWGWALVAGLILVGTFVLCVRAIVVGAQNAAQMPSRRYRVARFAEANGLTFELVEQGPEPAGLLLGKGSDGRLERVLRWPDDGIEAGTYHYVTRSVKSTTPWSYDYARIRGLGSAPELFVDVRSTGSRRRLYRPMHSYGARTGLDAPGGAHFTMWTLPRSTARARRFVDDELLELLALRDVNLELAGDDAFVYLRLDTMVPMTDPDLWRWLLDLAAVLRERARA